MLPSLPMKAFPRGIVLAAIVTATAFAPPPTAQMFVRSGERNGLNFAVSGPTLLDVENVNGSITIEPKDRRDLLILVDDARFTPDDEAIIVKARQLQAGHVQIEVVYPTRRIPVVGTVPELMAAADPAKGFIANDRGVVVGGRMTLAAANPSRFREGSTHVNGAVGMARLRIEVPRHELSHLRLRTKTGDLVVGDFGSEPEGISRVVSLYPGIGSVSLGEVVASGGIWGIPGSDCETGLDESALFDGGL